MRTNAGNESSATLNAASSRIVLLASLGGALEFYDFVIFGVFAKDIADAVFPNPTPLISLMVSFAAFAAGYLARPFGGIVLSHFGDRYGRRGVFLISIFVMSAATVGMGARAVVRRVGRGIECADGRCSGWCRVSVSAASSQVRSPTSSKPRRTARRRSAAWCSRA